MLLTKEKGKVTTETNKLRNKPSKKKATDKRPQITHKASLTVNNQIIPSRLNSKIKVKVLKCRLKFQTIFLPLKFLQTKISS